MRQIKKVPFKDLKGKKLTKPELGFITGGYTINLPEVVITCGQDSGRCWKCLFVNKNEFSGNCRYFSGYQTDNCSAMVKCNDL